MAITRGVGCALVLDLGASVRALPIRVHGPRVAVAHASSFPPSLLRAASSASFVDPSILHLHSFPHSTPVTFDLCVQTLLTTPPRGSAPPPWLGYPHTHLSGAMKRYYVLQIGYWPLSFFTNEESSPSARAFESEELQSACAFEMPFPCNNETNCLMRYFLSASEQLIARSSVPCSRGVPEAGKVRLVFGALVIVWLSLNTFLRGYVEELAVLAWCVKLGRKDED
ncbi:hypothetical protein B0H16DRAFT_1746291 [Mycena metata]|uniref:Uncharacterized protein n=1 Tax=Mycena metata TaxID=1033252 RepID=A0AAD7GYW4_9AGAR|nr:hypothetical protein B0H16DRAFT_1746291 [Mycena metata]